MTKHPEHALLDALVETLPRRTGARLLDALVEPLQRPDTRLLDALVEPLRRPDARLPDALVEPLRRPDPTDALRLIARNPEQAAALLRRHRIGAAWLAAVRRQGQGDLVPPALADPIDAGRQAAITVQLVQEAAARRVGAALDEAGVPHVFFKGVHLGPLLYPDPAHRPAGDVDVLVRPADRDRALSALAALGLTGRPEPSTVSHEVALRGLHVELDVHWSPLRPGRARVPLADDLVASRRRQGPLWQGPLWVPSDAWTLAVVLLVHPALTDHVTGRLGRALDLDRWLARFDAPGAAAHLDGPGAAAHLDGPPASARLGAPWAAARVHLERAGLRTAAWAMLTWTQRWLGTPVPPGVMAALAPGPARRAYLSRWLHADPAARYREHPLAVRAGFSLALEDGPGDVVRAARAVQAARRAAAGEMAAVEGALGRGVEGALGRGAEGV